MKRLTTKSAGTFKVKKELTKLEDNYVNGIAIDKLGRFEDMTETLINKQHEIEERLNLLRSEEKVKTVKFNEALAEKFTNLRLISLMQSYKLIDSDEFD